jgi:hypothetical protein
MAHRVPELSFSERLATISGAENTEAGFPLFQSLPRERVELASVFT